ncbi:MAG TPA: hypothetical protein VF432_15800 [Thermoanaerobaculia bacterium]
MKMSPSIRFYLLAGVIAVVGAVDLFVVKARKLETPGTDTTVTDTAEPEEPSQCLGDKDRSITIGYKPVASSDVNDAPSQFIRDIVESALKSAGCEVHWSSDLARLDLLIERPDQIRKRHADQQWIETSPYAVVQMKTVGSAPIEQLAESQEIHVDAQWEVLLKEHYPKKTIVAASDPLNDLKTMRPVWSAIIRRSVDDSTKKATHKVIPVDIPLTMALNPARKQILGPLNSLFASPVHAESFSKSAKKVSDIAPPPK